MKSSRTAIAASAASRDSRSLCANACASSTRRAVSRCSFRSLPASRLIRTLTSRNMSIRRTSSVFVTENTRYEGSTAAYRSDPSRAQKIPARRPPNTALVATAATIRRKEDRPRNGVTARVRPNAPEAEMTAMMAAPSVRLPCAAGKRFKSAAARAKFTRSGPGTPPSRLFRMIEDLQDVPELLDHLAPFRKTARGRALVSGRGSLLPLDAAGRLSRGLRLLLLFGGARRRLQSIVEASLGDFRLEALLRAGDGKAFVVEELADTRNDPHVPRAVEPRRAFVPALRERRELRLPVAQNVRRDLGDFAGFSRFVERTRHRWRYFNSARPGAGDRCSVFGFR